MINLVVSGEGGPMLLLLSGCLVGSGVRWEWHWNWLPTSRRMFGSDITQGGAGYQGIAFPSNHASTRGALCRTIPRLWTMMYMYYSGLLNGFWTKHNDTRPSPMASPGSGPNFRRGGYGPCCKVGVQGLRPKWAWGASCHTSIIGI